MTWVSEFATVCAPMRRPPVMRKPDLALVLLTVLVVATQACVRRVAPPAVGPPNEPRISWTITAGPQDGNESEICRSDAQKPCVLQSSTAGRPMAVAISVYMYDAGAPTKYSGALQSSFIEAAGGRGYEAKVDYSIEPDELPTAVTTAGRLTSSPGDHTFRVALLAEVPGHMDPHQFEQVIPVRVVTSGSGAAAP